MGAGNLSQTPKELLRSYGQALAAMRFSALDRYQGGVAYWADMGPSKVLAVLDRGTLEDIIDPRVASLAEEDPELLLTVAQHLENVNRPAATADALHIHRGTLYYRLKKFEAHTGLDLDKGSDRLSVQLSLLARHIRNGPKLGHTGG
jgi:sugar diacid utilization regulator